jgi:DNA binding domain, excisionase family
MSFIVPGMASVVITALVRSIICQAKGGIVDVNRDRLYSLEELSKALNLSLRTLQRLVYSGDLPAVRLGRRVFVVGSALLDGLPKVEAKAKPKPRGKRGG